MKNVLIVDDEKILLNRLVDGFEPYSDQFAVLTARNGKQALEVLETNSVDLLVTDLNMPEMSGIELLTHVNESHPHIPFIVMTAFGTPEIEEQLNRLTTLKYIEKPFSFDELADVIVENLGADIDQGSMKGISLANFMQLIAMEEKTCLLDVRSDGENTRYGLVYCRSGELYNTIYGDLEGEDAIYKLLSLEDVRITFRPLPRKKIKRRIFKGLMSILMESARRQDESGDSENSEEAADEIFEGVMDENSMFDDSDDAMEVDAEPDRKEDSGPTETEETNPQTRGGSDMSAVTDILERFKDVEGFLAAGVFTPDGEMAAELNISGVKIAEIGALANDVLLKSQKATEMMGMGRGNQVHIESPKSHILARCLNEATDFAATSSGRAHIHTVLVLNKESGNIGMGKIKLNSIVEDLAPNFR